MRYLIDGYNLLHVVGLSRQKGRTGLTQARGRLLGMLHGALGDEGGRAVTVVFDAAKAPPGADAEQSYHGIQVLFAIGDYEADDLIEQLIKQASAPKQLAVVSDDHRIQRAARRRRCTVLGCAEFLEWLDKQRRRSPPPPNPSVVPPAKPEGTSHTETQHWLREFADLDKDPDMKAAFQTFDFEDFEDDDVPGV